MVSTVLAIKTYIRVYNLFNSLRDVGITASERRRLRLWDIQERLSPPCPPNVALGLLGSHCWVVSFAVATWLWSLIGCLALFISDP